MSDASRIIVKATPSISPKEARDARARGWAFVLECFHRRTDKEAVPRQNGPDDAKGKSKNDSRAKTSIP